MTTVKHLEGELRDLETALAQIDIAGLERQHSEAKSARGAYSPPRSSLTIDSTERQLIKLEGEAAQLLDNARSKAKALTRKIDPLAQLLSAPGLLVQCREDQLICEDHERTARELLTTAQGLVATLTARLSAARVTRTTAQNAAAHAVLTASKQGENAAPAHVDSSEIYVLTQAVALAQNEADSAESQHAAAMSDANAARRRTEDAQRNAAALVFELEQRRFAESVAAYRAAGGDLDTDDLWAKIYTIEAETNEA